MNFEKHSELAGTHAFLSPSRHSWVNYDEEKLCASYLKFCAVAKGTELHELAKRCIELKVKLPKSNKSLHKYVNDAIAFRMLPEQPLFYSVNAYGTADSISFVNNFLRIHDLKTGASPVSIKQLEVYAALFCLEYRVSPFDIKIELRIYQSDEILVHIPTPDEICYIMDKIVLFDKKIEQIKAEEQL